MEKLIAAEHLSFHYTDEEGKPASPEILKDLTLTLEAGSFVAVLGHNGCGKSTLAKHMNAILLPTGGKMWIAGIDTCDEEKLYEIRQHVGMVFQNPDNQIVATIVEEDVAFGPCFAEAVLETEVKQVVLQGAAQQELHAQVVDLLCLLLFSFVYKFVAAANEQVAHHKCGCFVEFIVGSVLCGNAVNVRELLTDCALDLRGGHLVIHSLSSMCYA